MEKGGGAVMLARDDRGRERERKNGKVECPSRCESTDHQEDFPTSDGEERSISSLTLSTQLPSLTTTTSTWSSNNSNYTHYFIPLFHLSSLLQTSFFLVFSPCFSHETNFSPVPRIQSVCAFSFPLHSVIRRGKGTKTTPSMIKDQFKINCCGSQPSFLSHLLRQLFASSFSPSSRLSISMQWGREERVRLAQNLFKVPPFLLCTLLPPVLPSPSRRKNSPTWPLTCPLINFSHQVNCTLTFLTSLINLSTELRG